jgi:hypothetical protein
VLSQVSSPAHDDRIKRLRIISELQKSLSKAQLGPTIDVRVLPFGSFVNELYEPRSDLGKIVRRRCGRDVERLTNIKVLADLAIVGQIIVPDDISPDDKRFSFAKIHLVRLGGP